MLSALIILGAVVHAQPVPDTVPFVETYRPLQFLCGFPTDEQPSTDNFEIKFQFGLRLNFWHHIGGRDWNGYFTFSQVSTWNILGYSSPFRDNMFMPGLFCEHSLRRDENGIVTDYLQMGLEHRSNGKIRADSRRINVALLCYTHRFDNGLALHCAGRFGVGSVDDVPMDFDIFMRYLGFVSAAVSYTDSRWQASVAVTPYYRTWGCNLRAEASYRLGRRHDFPRLTLQYQYGYDEVLLDCAPGAAPRSMLRMGLTINPQTQLFL